MTPSAQNEQPLVSILTPVYNGAAFLSECIEGVLKQTYRNFEYLIVNNCSTDASLEIAERYAATDSRIRICDNKEFLAVIDNHNNAFNQMSPEARYCKVVSADDSIAPTCIERMVGLFEAHPSVGIVGCYQLSGSVIRWQGLRYPTSVISGREIGRRWFLEVQEFFNGLVVLGFGSPTSLMYRADIVRATKAFYPNPSPHADTSACFAALRSCDFGFVFEVLAYETTHEATQTSTSRAMNRYLPAMVNDLLQYGQFYLTPEEYRRQLAITLRNYRRFLAVCWFTESRGEEFWNYHRTQLQQLGFPLTRFTLIKSGLLTALEECINPGLAISKLRKHRRGRAQEKSDAARTASAMAAAASKKTTLAKTS